MAARGAAQGRAGPRVGALDFVSRARLASRMVTDDARPGRRSFNFSAGPSALPTDILARVQRELLDWRGTGMGILEMSHRDAGGPVQEAMARAEASLRRLLAITDDYAVLFVHGGAHGQFAALPLNLAAPDQPLGYVDTGFWSRRARDEGARFAPTAIVASAENGGARLPAASGWTVPRGAAYVHLCANETIQGLEYLSDPDPTGDVPLVADFTSTLLSRPIDVARYGALYASSGKNLGPAGFAVVVVKRSLIARGARPQTPSILDWSKLAEPAPIASLYSTPATFAIYVSSLVLEDLEARGGLVAAERRSSERAARVYARIDASSGFYTNAVHPPHRSRMNVPFRIRGGDSALEARFVREAEALGLHQLFGHPRFGGLRASLYHGVPDAAVDALDAFLVDFGRRTG